MLLQLATWQEVDQYLQTNTSILIPIGSTEQHGPNGLIGTDAICPQVIAQQAAKQIQLLIAPTINIGMAQHHLGFAGTISLRPSTLLAYLVDVLNSLHKHGFNQFYFLNGHGGNVATINAAFSEFYAASSFALQESNHSSPHCALHNWWEGKRVKQLSRELFPNTEGWHATPSEISLTYFAHPEAIKQVSMHPEVAAYGSIRDAADYRRQFPDGRIGSNPAGANLAAGEKLFHAAVADTLEDLQEFLKPSA